MTTPKRQISRCSGALQKESGDLIAAMPTTKCLLSSFFSFSRMASAYSSMSTAHSCETRPYYRRLYITRTHQGRHTHTRAHTHTRTHARTHTHTHTHTHTADEQTIANSNALTQLRTPQLGNHSKTTGVHSRGMERTDFFHYKCLRMFTIHEKQVVSNG